MKELLSPSRLNDYLGCAHQSALWLDGVAPPDHVDENLELIRKKGFEHEADVLARLEAQYGAAANIDPEKELDERIADTVKAINSNVALIYQGALRDGNWIGYPDFLVRLPGASDFQPEDAKLARKAKAGHLFQLGIYAEMLQALAKTTVGAGIIHVAGGPPQSFDLRQTRYILKRLMKKFETFVANPLRATRAVPCAACDQCDFKPRCESEWRAKDSVFFVAGVSAAQAVKLEQAGLHTLGELSAAKAGTKVDGIGIETLAKLIAQARLQLRARESGKHEVELHPHVRGRGFGLLPPADSADLFFDMEGDPLFDEGLEYLFGVYGCFDGKATSEFRALWGHSHEEEKGAFTAFMQLLIDHFAKNPQAHIYHYAQYEPNALKRLAMRYATMEAELDQMLRDRRFVDLYRVTVQAVRLSTESYSLKEVEKFYRPAREGDVKTAAASIVEYERWRVTGEKATLESIERYNEVDCVSTAGLRDWLESLRPAGAIFEIIDETKPDKQQKSAEREQLEARKQTLAASVRAAQNGSPQVRDLIAELLWFHQRAQKPGWWALFERQNWSDEELIEDAESLGALSRDPAVEPVRDKQSVETRYLFPPQDTKLKQGDTPRIAATLGYAGKIMEVDAEQGFAVLRRGVKSGPMPDRFNLLPAPISMRDVPDAVMRFAERFSSNQLQNDRALIDILSRNLPRFTGRDAGTAILPEGEDLTDGTIRAVRALDHSYLFVQGPPGTGKTYTISHVICDLIGAGFRVGVSSNSHKAINKVLEEVEKRAAEKKISFRGAKKGSDGEEDTHFNGANIGTVFNSEDVTSAHRLVGGTVFHFSRSDQQGAFDYLIVDEAGQVALGNLVAMAGAASNIVLVGDQMQLPQPVQGVHPGETGLSCLEYLLQERATVPPDQGILLNESRRLHPDLCTFISDAIYDGRLKSHPIVGERRLILSKDATQGIKPSGLSLLPLWHEGCTQSSHAEANEVAKLVANLLTHQVRHADGKVTALGLNDILVVAPYNLQVNLLKQKLPRGAKVGTVDKFQGQEAAVVIVSMTTSKGSDAPRGTEFLFSPNRFNVAISRAKCLAIVVHGADLLEGVWTRLDDLHRLNLFAQAETFAQEP